MGRDSASDRWHDLLVSGFPSPSACVNRTDGFHSTRSLFRSCVGALNLILDPKTLPGVRSSIVTLLPPLAVIVHDPLVVAAEKLVGEIEDGGYGATIISSVAAGDGQREDVDKGLRTAKLRIDGMFCG